nr:hypothetical protein [Streptomyces sp. NRRL S-920]
MDDAPLVGRFEGLQECVGDAPGTAHRQALLLHEVFLEGATGHQLHHDPGRLIHDDDVVDADNVRVVPELCRVARLASGDVLGRPDPAEATRAQDVRQPEAAA